MIQNKPEETREQLENDIENINGRIQMMMKPKQYFEKIKHNMKHVKRFVLEEGKTYNPVKDDHVMITYWLTGEPVPVKILKVFRNNTYFVDFNVDGSTAIGAPNATIKNSDIISPYKPLKSPVGTGYISSNTNMSIRQVHQASNDMYL